MVETPTQISERAVELLRAFAEEMGHGAEPERERFYAKVQELFAATMGNTEES